MRLSSRTRTTLRQYWGDRLGISSEAFTRNGVSVGTTAHGGVHLFCFDETLIISVPTPLQSIAEHRTHSLENLDTSNRAEIVEWFGNFDTIETVLGPAFWGYTDQEVFNSIESDARILVTADDSAYDAFRSVVSEDDWDNGGPSFVAGETVGLFVKGKLVAVSGYEVWDELIAHISVVTHPEYRENGYGQAVVSRATETALTEGLLPQYRTLDAWPWSVALAQKLGYTRFATGYFGVIGQ